MDPHSLLLNIDFCPRRPRFLIPRSHRHNVGCWCPQRSFVGSPNPKTISNHRRSWITPWLRPPGTQIITNRHRNLTGNNSPWTSDNQQEQDYQFAADILGSRGIYTDLGFCHLLTSFVQRISRQRTPGSPTEDTWSSSLRRWKSITPLSNYVKTHGPGPGLRRKIQRFYEKICWFATHFHSKVLWENMLICNSFPTSKSLLNPTA